MRKEDLELLLSNKVKPMVDEVIKKFIGVKIGELGESLIDKLEKPVFEFSVDITVPFKESKKKFRKLFILKMLELHQGNVSVVADIIGLDRRTIHRDIENFKIDVDSIRSASVSSKDYQLSVVNNVVSDVIEDYRSIIHPVKLKGISDYVPTLSSDILKIIPFDEPTWDSVEIEFERRYIQKMVQVYGSKKVIAEKMGLRYETLIRKMKKLGI